MEFLLLSVMGVLLALSLSGFIIYFDRKKFTTVRMGFYYLLTFFIAGFLMLAAITKDVFSKINN